MGHHPKGINPSSLPLLHATMAQNVLGSDFAPELVLYSYWKSFNGFVMKLTDEEAKTMAGMENVVSVFPNRRNKIHTTRSWDFVGLSQKVKRSDLESDVIVGVLDSGIWPKSESFSDKGYGPPPAKWKGSCHNFPCNKKIIGAKYFNCPMEFDKDDIKSPIDTNGHGTHTASTVAGNSVGSASLLGLGSGTARGGVPSARIAVYKVCWGNRGTCHDADILAAFDEAISDGVDIISLSVGARGGNPAEYFEDATAIGAFHAMARGILTSNSAGNDGPESYTMSTLAPWLISVAATTIDRKFSTKLQLGNGLVFDGISINTFDLKDKQYSLIHASDAPNVRGGFNSSFSRYCFPGSLDRELVKEKIVMCDYQFADNEVAFIAAGVVQTSPFPKDYAVLSALPAIDISFEDGKRIHSYMKSSRNLTATISRTCTEKDLSAPYVASFSSRGPNPINPDILKPDISAPGVDILAAWSSLAPISNVKGDNRNRHFNIIFGTSMACPHVTASAVYVKTFHPKWSPSAIKSALMTTATPLSAAMNPDAEFAYGAGQINPVKALNPGLVYDAKEIDYVKFLCRQSHYDDKKLRSITWNHRSSCAEFDKEKHGGDLNLPSFALQVNVSLVFPRSFHRTVTNVGFSTSKYEAKIIAPPSLTIQVKPKVLHFTSLGQKKSYKLTVEGIANVDILSASLIWDDGTFQVRSPIVVYSDQIAFHPHEGEEANT
ncbi:cucumisin-like [Neltuma alba]|uniref:cucumisin-like n=1 Tax=Neltuma alba TaxID=207710 RepID=UPI0010A430B8|nr:cucumisin-like [Prosopis alba]